MKWRMGGVGERWRREERVMKEEQRRTGMRSWMERTWEDCG